MTWWCRRPIPTPARDAPALPVRTGCWSFVVPSRYGRRGPSPAPHGNTIGPPEITAPQVLCPVRSYEPATVASQARWNAVGVSWSGEKPTSTWSPAREPATLVTVAPTPPVTGGTARRQFGTTTELPTVVLVRSAPERDRPDSPVTWSRRWLRPAAFDIAARSRRSPRTAPDTSPRARRDGRRASRAHDSRPGALRQRGSDRCRRRRARSTTRCHRPRRPARGCWRRPRAARGARRAAPASGSRPARRRAGGRRTAPSRATPRARTPRGRAVVRRSRRPPSETSRDRWSWRIRRASRARTPRTSAGDRRWRSGSTSRARRPSRGAASRPRRAGRTRTPCSSGSVGAPTRARRAGDPRCSYPRSRPGAPGRSART